MREGAVFTRTADVRGCTHAVDRHRAVATLGTTPHHRSNGCLPAIHLPASARTNHPPPSLCTRRRKPQCRGRRRILRPFAPRRRTQVAPTLTSRRTNVTDLLNQTSLHELIWLIRRAAFVVSVDSGPMHIAAALTPRLVSIHTWSDPAKVGPYRPDAWIWKERALYQMRDIADSERRESCPDIAALAAFVSLETSKPSDGGAA
jgi:hypothetical protein